MLNILAPRALGTPLILPITVAFLGSETLHRVRISVSFMVCRVTLFLVIIRIHSGRYRTSLQRCPNFQQKSSRHRELLAIHGPNPKLIPGPQLACHLEGCGVFGANCAVSVRRLFYEKSQNNIPFTTAVVAKPEAAIIPHRVDIWA